MIMKDITLNGKKHTLLTYYYKDDSVENETILYMVYNEIYFDNKKVLDINLDNAFTEESERTIYINNLKNTNSDNKFIKDLKDDKEYKITIENGVVNKVKTRSYSGNELVGAGGC